MKTPIQELINFFKFVGEPEAILGAQQYLKKEKEFAYKCFIAGADYGLDLSASIEWGENGTMPTFDEFFKKFEDEKS